MNTNFEQVRALLNQWIAEAVQHLTQVFPHIAIGTIEPLVREQVTKAFNEAVANKFAELNGVSQ